MPRRNSSADESFPPSGNASASPSTDFSYEAEIVRRMATISRFHAPSSRATLVSAQCAKFFYAPIVLILLLRLRLIRSSRQGSSDARVRALLRLAIAISIHGRADIGHC